MYKNKNSLNNIEQNLDSLDLSTTNLICRTTLIDLVYDMNTNLHHKMNFIILAIQTILLVISVFTQIIFHKTITIRLSSIFAILSILFLFLIIIGNILSDKALKKANQQKHIIMKCIDKIEKENRDEKN